MYKYAVNKHAYPTDVTLQSVAIWNPVKWPVHYHNSLNIKTHGCVSVAKKAVWCTSVLFTGTANSPFSPMGWFLSNSHILCPPYTRSYIPNLKEIGPVVCKICILKIAPFSSPFSSSLHRFTKVTLNQPKTPFPWIDFFQIWHTYKACCSLP